MSDLERSASVLGGSINVPTTLVIPSLYGPSAAHEQAKRTGPGFLNHLVVEEEHVWLNGFTVYVVEQWIVDRDRTLSTIVVYTGNEADKIAVDILVPSPELGNVDQTMQAALKRLRSDGARPKDTPCGIIFVTALPNFRSDLNIVQIPGSVADFREQIFANIALRRLGCGGRSSLSIQGASPPQQEKFYSTFQLHQVNGTIDFTRAVLALVCLVQHALSLYGLGPLAATLLAQGVPAEEADVCDTTVTGINRFTIEVGERLCRVEPGEGGVLSPSTLSILLTSVVCLRARLHALGVHHVPSDPFTSRRRFLQVFRQYTNGLGFVDRVLSADALLAVRRNVADHPDGFLRSRLKYTIEEVSRLTDVTGDRRSLPEEETGDISIFVNGLQRAHWASTVASVHILWTGKLKPAGPALRIPPIIKRHRHEQMPLDGYTSSEAELEPSTRTATGALKKGPTLIAKAGRAVGAGLTGKTARGGLEPIRQSLSTNSARSEIGPKNEVLLGAPYLLGVPSQVGEQLSRSPSPNASSLALDESLVDMPRIREKGRFRSMFGGGGNARLPHCPSAQNGSRDDLGSGGPEGLLTPPMRPQWMRRSITNQSSTHKLVEREELGLPLRRRHSYGDPSDLQSQTAALSQRRLRLDVELCAAYFDLRAYEQHLSSLSTALADIDKIYAETAATLDEPLRKRQQELRDLEERANAADGRLETVIGEAPKPEHISRNEYVQTVFLGNVNELERLQESLETAVGPKGTLIKRAKISKKGGSAANTWSHMFEGLAAQCRAGLDRIWARAEGH